MQPAPRSSQPLLVPDAFSNRQYTTYALKGCVAGLLCYVLDSSVAWPVIMGACAEICIVSARPLSVGAGTRNERLFVSVAALIVGGVVLGFGSHGLLLPSVDSITGFHIAIRCDCRRCRLGCDLQPAAFLCRHIGSDGLLLSNGHGLSPNPPLGRSGAFMVDLVLALLAFWLVLDGASDALVSRGSRQFA